MGCLKFLLGCGCCLAVLAAGGVVAWRYGPWYDDDDGDTSSSFGDPTALNACEGCCNGLASNCDLPVDRVTFPMVHNAHSSLEDYFVAYNNNRKAEDALVAGYRGLMLDSCVCDGSIGEYIQDILKGQDNGQNYLGFCHKSCDAGVRNPAELLGNIKTFLDVNKNEVLMIEFEINDDSLLKLFNAIEVSGLGKYVYRPEDPLGDWPTLRSLIDADTRLLLFAHGDGMESCVTADCPDILYTYDHFRETNWNDDTCDVKGNGGSAAGRKFFLMNHWMNNEADLPSESNAEEWNAYERLRDRIGGCGDRMPNVFAVDFWDVGNVLEFVRDVNVRNAAGGESASEARVRGD